VENETELSKDSGKKKAGTGFIVQGTILAASGIISSLIGLLYRLPLTRIIGDEGNGYYSAAYNVYTIILLLSSYSLPLAVSKMVSARLAKKSYRSAGLILRASLCYATLVGGLGAAVIWFGSGWFASSFLHIPNSEYALKALAPTVWIVSYLGVFRGYYQGHSTMVPTALSQIIEQIINALVSVGAAWYLADLFLKNTGDLSGSKAFGAMGGTIGTGAGALSALVMFMILFYSGREKRKKRITEDKSLNTETFGGVTQVLFLTVVPVILSTAIYNAGSIVDNSIFGHFMFANGLSSETASDYGIYTAKYKLLINVPISIANSLSSSLIPALSMANAARDRGQVENGVSKATRFSMIVAIPCAVGMAVLADPIITLLFGKSEKAVMMMRIGSAGVIFYSLSTVSNAILQGTSHMRIPVRHAFVSLLINAGVLLLFLNVFHLGIFGVVAADMVFACTMCVLNTLSIRRLLDYRQEIRRTFLGPLVCALIMGGATWFLYSLLGRITKSLLILTVVPVIAAMFLYAVLLIRSGMITAYELSCFPKGRFLVKTARAMHLID